MNTLHITNGDVTVDLLKAGNLSGSFLPWRDVLHMGPVPAELELSELSAVRAKFIADLGWGNEQKLQLDFNQRDQALRKWKQYDKVVLWFEHDLYDQLQLIQLLDFFVKDSSHSIQPELVNTNSHLGYYSPKDVAGLYQSRQIITQAQLQLGSMAWQAYRQSSPYQWSELLHLDTAVLPHLKNAVMRSLQELPNSQSGLNRTEFLMLQIIHQGVSNKRELFAYYNKLEPNAFHGDSGFFWYLDQLVKDTPTIVTKNKESFSLTQLGDDILNLNKKWHRHYNADHWLGGHKINTTPRLCWDNKQMQLVETI